MPTARSNSLITIVIVLVVMALLSGASLVVGSLGAAGAGGFRQGRGPGGFAAGTPAPGSTQGGSASAGAGGGSAASAGAGGGGTGGNFQGGNGGNFTGRGGGGGGFLSFLTLPGIFRALGIDFQYMGPANVGVPGLGIVFLLISALGLWMQKRWALYLTIVVGIVFLIAALPGVLSLGFGRFSLLRTGMTAVNAIGALAVVIMSLLPSTRKSVS